MLEARELGCERDERQLFADLNFSLERGDVLRVEGPNGSGKSTLLRCLAGLTSDHEGQVFWRGTELGRCREAFALDLLYLGHRPGVEAVLTPLENLTWYQDLAAAGERADASAALDAAGLAGYELVPCAQLSAGQHRRVALARLWLNTGDVWLLDEPLTYIDAEGTHAIAERIEAHRRSGGVVVYATHTGLPLDGERVLRLGMPAAGSPATGSPAGGMPARDHAR